MKGAAIGCVAGALAATVILGACSSTEPVPLPPERPIPQTGLEVNTLIIGDIAGMDGATFDSVRVTLVGADWQPVGVVEAPYIDGRAVLTLPAIPSTVLCRVARETYNDYEGWWPAEGVSDREARVGGFADNNIIALRGGQPVGRLYVTDRNPAPVDVTIPGGAPDRHHIYYHYADRPFTLSGHNLVRGNQRRAFRYAAEFTTGWNAYMNVTYFPGQAEQNPPPSLCTTEIPAGLALRWHFEAY